MYRVDEIEQILSWSREYGGLSPDRVLLGASSVPLQYRPAVATQIQMAQQLESKLPTWAKRGVYIPSGINLEQATSELCASYKSRYVTERDTLLDMTGGLGVDFVSLAAKAKAAVYTELDKSAFSAAKYNLPRLLAQSDITLLNFDSSATLLQLLQDYSISIIYIDPARRGGQKRERRVYAIEDCTPNLYQVVEAIRTSAVGSPPRILAKLSPMLDITHTLQHIAGITAIDILSLRSEVKELLLHISFDSSIPYTSVELRCIDLHPNRAPMQWHGTLEQEAQASCSMSSNIERYLYEPNAAIMKSGLYKLLAHSYGLHKLAPNTHLYTSAELKENFPGKVFEVLEIIPFQSSKLKSLHKRLSTAMIATRNFPMSTEALRRKLRIKDGGTTTLWGVTTTDSLPLLLHCQVLDHHR